MKRLPILLCVCLFLGFSGVAQPIRDNWNTFLQTPDENNYERLANQIVACSNPDCARDVGPDGARLQGLIGLIVKGNSLSIDLGLVSRRMLGGGALEDLTRALGSSIDRTPTLFLKQAKARHLTSSEIRSIVKMLPSDVIDSQGRRRQAVASRIASLESVTEPGLVALRDTAITILRN